VLLAVEDEAAANDSAAGDPAVAASSAAVPVPVPVVDWLPLT
jgi:hypothetical protein